MFGHGRACRPLAAVVLTFTVACSSTPTGPSPTASPSATGDAAAESSSTAQNEPGATTQGDPLGATRFVALGDSITFGVLSSFDVSGLCRPAEPPPIAYPNVLQAALNNFHSPQAFTVENCGIPGEGTGGGASRIHALLSELRPQGLLVLEGINDLNGGASIGSTVDNLRSILDIARVHNVTVFIATMFQTYYSVDPNNGRIRENSAALIPEFNNAIVQMASGRQNVYIVDVYGRFGSNRSLVGGDGLHPSESGYEQMSVAFGLRIAEAFAVRRGFQ